MGPETSIYGYVTQGMARVEKANALWYYGRSMSYGELFQRIDGVARGLAALGVGKGTVVTIHLPNSPQAVMSVYAVAKLGGVCDMAHPLIPVDALEADMAFSGSRILITGGQMDWRRIARLGATVVLTDMSAHMGGLFRMAYRMKNRPVWQEGTFSFEELENVTEAVEFPPPDTLANEPAVYLHSSGTTGSPKTVVHSHCSLNNWIENSIVFYKGKRMENQRLLAVLPMFHGSGLVLDMHQLLCGGGELDILSRFEPKLALKLLKKRRITHMTGVPALYQRLLGLPGFCAEKLPDLRECYISGDRVGAELKATFAARFGTQAALYEGYGMTETVTACCSNGIWHHRAESSGCPLENCAAAVLDKTGQILMEGEGELLLSTNCMMLGYLKDLEATRAAFLSYEGRQWLRTGDWGRIDNEGYVYFLERIKHIIVRKGYNIYPVQVEAAVCTATGVEEACVVGVLDSDTGTQTVCAWVVLSQGSEEKKTEDAIRANCTKLLPPYARPGRIYFINELPRNRMAKIERKALGRVP